MERSFLALLELQKILLLQTDIFTKNVKCVGLFIRLVVGTARISTTQTKLNKDCMTGK